MTTEQTQALRRIAKTIIETVQEADHANAAIGAPGGYHFVRGL